MKWLYLSLNVGSFLVPFLFSFYPKAPFYKEWKYLLPAICLTAFGFIIWDQCFTQMGVWGFNSQYLLGIYLGDLPIEEVMFFFFIPYACAFIYFSLKYYLKQTALFAKRVPICYVLGFISVVFALFHYQQWYTFTAFLGAGISALFLAYRNPAWLGHFLLAYCISFIPFLLVNGILTGSFIEAEVVWYNNLENLNLRIFTIPIEDNFYSFLMLSLCIGAYEHLKSRKSNSKINSTI